jgi:hypothetical protein
MIARNAEPRSRFILIALGILFFSSCAPDHFGAKVSLENVGTAPLRSVVIRVTGKSYSVGDVAAGESRVVETYPTGESHVVIELVDDDGSKKEFPIDCYFESGYRSIINVKLTASSVLNAEVTR